MKNLAASCLLLLLASGGTAAQSPDLQAFQDIARGRYLTIAADCGACHTPIGGKPYSGGRAIDTPFGKLVAPNITPDATGIGQLSEQDFDNILRNGTGPGGFHLYPAMPYTYYTKLTTDDVRAIRAYLMSLEPVHNKVEANQLPFPFNVRASMTGWDQLFFKKGEFQSDPQKSAAWNRGAYLFEAAEHCGLCHTPKNALGGDEASRALQGTALQGWFAPNLTSDQRQGLGAWSEDDIVLYLKTGRNRFDLASGPMAEAVVNSTSHLTDADLRAIATYLKDLPAAGEAAQPLSQQDPVIQQGRAIYVDECAACHTTNGNGIVGIFPRLAGGAVVQQTDPISLIRVVLAGSQGAATDSAPTGSIMPSFAWKFSDDQVAAVVTYIRNSWGNAGSSVSAASVGTIRQRLQTPSE